MSRPIASAAHERVPPPCADGFEPVDVVSVYRYGAETRAAAATSAAEIREGHVPQGRTVASAAVANDAA